MKTGSKVVLHSVLIIITGGFWVIPLGVWYILKKK